jgi:rhodanese-related sulfurtransferase
MAINHLFYRLAGLFAPGMLLAGHVLAAGLTSVTPEELKNLQQSGAVVVDIRTAAEWNKTGVIPGSRELTYFDANGQSDRSAWLKSLRAVVPDSNARVILVCRAGHRSAMVGKMLGEEEGYAQVYHLEKGMNEWLAQRNPVNPP